MAMTPAVPHPIEIATTNDVAAVVVPVHVTVLFVGDAVDPVLAPAVARHDRIAAATPETESAPIATRRRIVNLNVNAARRGCQM